MMISLGSWSWENPKPVLEGATTWKASAGSVSGPMMSRNSTIEPGQL